MLSIGLIIADSVIATFPPLEIGTYSFELKVLDILETPEWGVAI